MLFIIVRVVCAALLFLALDSLDYGYYVFLRWVTCGVAAYTAYYAYGWERDGWAWTFGIIAVLFNPVIPVHLSREVWAPIDIVAGILLLVSIYVLRDAATKAEASSDGPDDLLKRATQEAADDDYVAAVETLRMAYSQISLDEYPISTFLRLPLYLQKAGKNDEAWGEFQKLNHELFQKWDEVTPMHLSQVYDKMRLFLQREGKYREAIHYAVWSYVSWMNGLYHQGRWEEMDIAKDAEVIQKKLGKHLVRPKMAHALDEIISIIQDEDYSGRVVDLKGINNKVAVALDGKGE